ncbi:MAG: sensor histidine kinase [Pseudonocardia sp.]
MGQAALFALPVAFLFGLARSHLDRAAVGRFVTELERAGPGERLADSLARALHDPTVTLAFPLPGQDGLVDDEGRPVSLPDGDGRTATPLRDRDGTLLAVLVHDASLVDHQELIESVAAAARLGLANERLRAHLHAQLQDVRASRARPAQAAAQERYRLERDLHDGAQQYLVTLGAVLALARTEVDPAAQPTLAASLDRSSSLLGHSLQDLRTLARGLSPPLLNESGLGPALLALTRTATVPVTTDIELPQRLPPLVEATAYFVVAEALANVVKHAGTCTAHVTAACRDGVLALAVTDRGRGGADPGGSGLRGLADRVAAVNGTFTVRSTPATRSALEASIPCGGR